MQQHVFGLYNAAVTVLGQRGRKRCHIVHKILGHTQQQGFNVGILRPCTFDTTRERGRARGAQIDARACSHDQLRTTRQTKRVRKATMMKTIVSLGSIESRIAFSRDGVNTAPMAML
jgi:hypothetical protein